MNESESQPLLTATYIGRRVATKWLLRHQSIEIRAGERIALTGPSGVGKTLLLRSLALLDPSDEGQVLWLGQSIPASSVPQFRSLVTYIHQRPSLREGTVEDNFRYPFTLQVHQSRQYSSAIVNQLLSLLGRSSSFLLRPARQLSGGEAQICALIRVLQLSPQILLLDEPTSALDDATVHLIEMALLQWIGEQPAERSIVWTSHSDSQVQRIASRVITMKHLKESQ